MGKTYRDLDVWQIGMDLVMKVYEITKTYPSSEEYGLKNQPCKPKRSNHL